MWPAGSRTGTFSVKVPEPCSRHTWVTGESGARKSTNSVIPPWWTNVSSCTPSAPGVPGSPRSSRMTSASPGMRNDVCRARAVSCSRSSSAPGSKISWSGQNRTRDPVTPRFARPTTGSALLLSYAVKVPSGPLPARSEKVPGSPRRKLIP